MSLDIIKFNVMVLIQSELDRVDCSQLSSIFSSESQPYRQIN